MNDVPPAAYSQLLIHPLMQQALYASHTSSDPTLTEEQQTALLVGILCIAFGSPYAQNHARNFVPAWLVAEDGSATWPRAISQGCLVAGTFFLLRKYIIRS